MARKENDFVAPENIQVIIPYSALEKMVNLAFEVEEIKAQNKRLEDQYQAIRGMFSECLDVVREIREFVKD